MLELLPALHVAGLVLRSARDQLPALQAHRERCTLLVSRCERLLDEVSAQCKEDHSPLIQRQLFSLESVCATIRDTIVDLAGKGLAWRLIYQVKSEKFIVAAEGKLTDAFFMFNVGTRISIGEIQAEIAEASRIDQLHFITYLENISQTDQQIIDALRNQNLRLEETLMAFMKHQQTRKAKSGNEPLSEQFIHRAVSALQRIGTSSSVEILPWQITSLEVEYERTEANLLGSGGFGKVFKGQWNGDIIALKEMHKSVFGETRNERHLKAFEKEIKIWSRLHHPRILPFYGACLASEKPFLVTKYCANGNVMDYMRDFPEVNRLLILHEISSGMVYLHEKTIIHADLKAANILIGDDHKALICDFGLSHLKDQTMSTSTMHTIQGTLNYMAPEYLDGAPIDYPADIYSFAMTAWQIYTGLVPFSDVPQRAFYRVVIDREERPEYPNSMSSPLWVLVQECWDQDPKSRPTFLEVEASLLPMVEPFLRRKRRQSLPINQMLAFSQIPQIPTPPESEHACLPAHYPTPQSAPQLPPVRAPTALDVVNVIPEDDWQPIERQPSTLGSLNSLDFFNKALISLGEVRSLEKYQTVSLLSYPNWLKPYQPYNTKTSRPQHVLKNRVKASMKRFNQALLDWVDRIPNLKNVTTTNVHRTTLLLTGTCTMAEFTFRKNSDAPHQYVQEFINDSVKANAFRARVEALVVQALNQYKATEDVGALANNLSQAVHEACR